MAKLLTPGILSSTAVRALGSNTRYFTFNPVCFGIKRSYKLAKLVMSG